MIPEHDRCNNLCRSTSQKICHLYGTDRTVVLRHHGKRQNFRCPYPHRQNFTHFKNMFLFNRNIAYHIIHCLPCFCVCVDIQLVFARQDPTPWIWSRCSWVTKIASRSSGLRPTSSNNEVIFCRSVLRPLGFVFVALDI